MMMTEEQSADAYIEMTDRTRDLLRVRHEIPKRHRIKPDLETHSFAELDCEKVPTWNEPLSQLLYSF
jgi:hypothetical protein